LVQSIDPLPLLLVGVALALHILGERRVARKLARPRSRAARWRACSFYAALAVTVVALEGPIDTYSPKLLWVHMLQHVLLLGIAAPLIALGAPWMSIWRPLPLKERRAVAKTVARSPVLAPVRWLGRLLGRPWPALIACSASLLLWHWPGAYDLALRVEAVHVVEHVTFILFGVLLWTQVLDSPPLHPRLRLSTSVYYVLAFDIACWLLSLVLAFASHPLYPAYAHLAHRVGGISALADQQIAGGVMLGPGSLAATLYVFIGLYRWLGQDEAAEPGRSRSATVRAPGAPS
jgi:putative membrane protein